MTLSSRTTFEPSAAAGAALEVLAKAAGSRHVAAEHRVIAAQKRFDPDEGLAMLDAYVAIADVDIRQAILDIVLTIAGINSDRRAKAIGAPSCGCATRRPR